MQTNTLGPPPLLDWGMAVLPLPGQDVCGDLYLVQPFANGALVAVVDGGGHGEEAFVAASVAVATLQADAHEDVLALLRDCHEALRPTRGAALTVASFNAVDGTMTWVGVGSVEGVLLRADAQTGRACEYVLLHGGVVGWQLPALRSFVIPVARGDTLLLATDGIRIGFDAELRLDEPPQQLAEDILARDAKGTDDALVLVARYLGGVP
jgi:hypothetical protein